MSALDYRFIWVDAVDPKVPFTVNGATVTALLWVEEHGWYAFNGEAWTSEPLPQTVEEERDMMERLNCSSIVKVSSPVLYRKVLSEALRWSAAARKMKGILGGGKVRAALTATKNVPTLPTT